MSDHYYAVIMAGGGGTRLWPLSRRSRPKQMLKLTGDQTLFQLAVSRLAGLFPPERILVVTVTDQAQELQKQCPEIPTANYLLEPMPRGTASVVGLAAVALSHRDPKAVMAVLTADHYIENVPAFQDLLYSAEEVARKGYLVTLGITPTYAATGYGYIQRGEPVVHLDKQMAYRVVRFKEKPNEATALELLKSGDHDWNSGMFIWQVSQILDEFAQHMPDLSHQLEEISHSWVSTEQQTVLRTVWPQIKAQTIDYGIMEKANRVAVLPAGSLGWNDVGSWESLFDVVQANRDGNILMDVNHLGIDTERSLVCADHTGRLIVTIGVQDLVIVDTDDALLICPREQAQKVREIVNILKQSDRAEFL